MKKARSALIIGLLLLTCASASAQNESPAYGVIKGRVTDTTTPRPNNLADAVITVESELILGTASRTTRTDQTGSYEIPNLPPGEYVVTTSKAGYDESKEYVTVTPGGEAFNDVRLYKTGTLTTHFGKRPVKVRVGWEPTLFGLLLLGLAAAVVVLCIIYWLYRLKKKARDR